MNNIISRIEIDSFRSVWRETLISGNINVFSGLNDVGKSNVLKAINLFFNTQTDFGVTYDFNVDYSKISFAAAQRLNKKKQQVKIKIYFNVPSSFRSLQGGNMWVERIFDRFGNMTENTSVDDAKKKAILTRFVNSVQYYYIPALKGPDVLKFILGEVGRRQLVSDKDIQQLNKLINDNIADLSEILIGSSISNETKFELPILVEDFWQRLNINTEYDEFKELDTKINPSKKGKRDDLKKEYF
jgi:predicted ATPase